MNKLKYTRTQNQEGVYGQKIPFSIDSQNVTMQNGNNLQESFENLNAEIDTKVNKEEGKGLSSNDFTTVDKTKLDGISRNANYTQIDATLSKRNNAADAKAVGDALIEVRSMVSAPPLIAATAAEMINTKKIYVYTGSEEGYKYGYWYYYENGWKVGGIYSQITVQNQLKALVNEATQKAGDAQNRLTTVEGKLTTDETDINTLKNKSFTFVEDGYVNNGIAYFTNNNQVLFEITGIGGGSSSGGDNPQESEYWSVKSKNWAVGTTGGGNASDTNNSKYWSSQSASYAHGGTNLRTDEDTDNAQYFKNESKKWAIGTTDTTSLPSDTNNAKYWANQAETYLQSTGQYWTNFLETKENQLEGQLVSYGGEIKNEMAALAESYIHGGTGTRDNEDVDNAQYYTNRAKRWAVGLTETSIPSDTNNAKYWANHAADVINERGQYWANLTESWTQGGTDSRQDEDINNAKYWSQQSENFYNNIQNNCVITFNGRKGDVTPTSGDYTSAMIVRNNSTVEADLQTIESTMATKANQVDLQNVQDSKIDNTIPLINLNTQAEEGTEDRILYDTIVELGWENTVIVN